MKCIARRARRPANSWGQDEYAFERVQAGLNSMFAPRGPIAPKEPVLVGFNHWLVDRYRRTDAAARVPAPGGGSAGSTEAVGTGSAGIATTAHTA